MKVGDYVRYKYENCIYIGKIKFISEVMGFDETLQFEINNCIEEILKEDIIKSSPNIIDLIEVGDYVNGMKVTDIKKDLLDNVEYIFGYSKEGFEGETMYYEEDIKSIVTKEQFESIEYKVGE